MKGCGEIGFTVLSMSASLVAVFIPILMMSGIVGRLFREFAVVLSVAIGVSLFVSLTTTPMMCARFLKHDEKKKHGFFYRLSERSFNGMLAWLRPFASLGFASPVPDPLRHDFYRRTERLHVQARQQGLFPAAGHRAH